MSDRQLLNKHIGCLWFLISILVVATVFELLVIENLKQRVNHTESIVQELIDELAPALNEGVFDHEA